MRFCALLYGTTTCSSHKQVECALYLGPGGVLLLDDGPLLSVQAVAHPKPLHKHVPVAVLPSLDHHAAHHLVLAQVHLPGGGRQRGRFDFTDKAKRLN